jgi:hypothetical protein
MVLKETYAIQPDRQVQSLAAPYFHILNWGMGRESTAILVDWILNPENRPESYPGSGQPMSLSQLIVITAQTGHEYDRTKELCEAFILPLLREHGIRFIQVARYGPSLKQGITCLEDTIEPYIIYHRPTPEHNYWRLGDEYRIAAAFPKLGRPHSCAQKFKGFVLDELIDRLEEESRNLYGNWCFGPYIGYSIEELGRMNSSDEYGCRGEHYRYPLIERQLTSEWCVDFLNAVFDVIWPKSACEFCPFLSREYAESRYIDVPEALVEALWLEWTAQLFNPRMFLFGHQSAWNLAITTNPRALQMFEAEIAAVPRWKLFRCMRIYDWKGEDADREDSDRFIEAIAEGTMQEMDDLLLDMPGQYSVQTQIDLSCRTTDKAGQPVVGQRIKGDRAQAYNCRPIVRRIVARKDWLNLPCVEDLYVVAPYWVQDKVQYANNFFLKWLRITGDAIESPCLQQQIWRERAKFGRYCNHWRHKMQIRHAFELACDPHAYQAAKAIKKEAIHPWEPYPTHGLSIDSQWMDDLQARVSQFPHLSGVCPIINTA